MKQFTGFLLILTMFIFCGCGIGGSREERVVGLAIKTLLASDERDKPVIMDILHRQRPNYAVSLKNFPKGWVEKREPVVSGGTRSIFSRTDQGQKSDDIQITAECLAGNLYDVHIFVVIGKYPVQTLFKGSVNVDNGAVEETYAGS